ncbi:MAG: hypothetical protein OXE86_16435 [Alphaproteobacteria bacterium]|nr:hypothetical protein [Alphaproteobacteria bacterium]
MRRAQGWVSEPAVVTQYHHRQIGHNVLRVRHSGRAGHLPDRLQPPRRLGMTMFNQTGLAAVGALAILVLVLVLA